MNSQDYADFDNLKNLWQQFNSYHNTHFTSGYNLFQKDLPGYFVNVSNSEKVLAVLTFLPFGSNDNKGLSLDYMLRSNATNSSVMEAAIAYCSNYFFDNGIVNLISLGLVPNPTSVNPIVANIGRLLNIKYSSLGLRGFKQKFQPTWQPRFVATEGFQALPVIYIDLQEILFDPTNPLT